MIILIRGALRRCRLVGLHLRWNRPKKENAEGGQRATLPLMLNVGSNTRARYDLVVHVSGPYRVHHASN